MKFFFNVFTGLGPGGLIIPSVIGRVRDQCIAGSSHGGKGHQWNLKAGPLYDIESMTSLLGGSGGESVYIIIFCNPATIFPLRSFATAGKNTMSDFIRPVDERKLGSLTNHNGDAYPKDIYSVYHCQSYHEA